MERISWLIILFCQLLLLQSRVNSYKDNANRVRMLLQNNEVDLESRVQSIERKLAEISKCVSQRGVAFTVRLSAHKPSLGNHQIIDFDAVVTNFGNAFNPATSIFTAPIDGVYLFDLNIGVNGNEDLEIIKNGAHLQRVYGYSTGHWEVSTAAVSTHLVEGDQVWVKHATYNSGLVGHELTSFSGVLVQPDCNLN